MRTRQIAGTLTLAVILFLATGCASPGPADQEARQQGSLEVDAPHALKPVNHEMYQVRNIKSPGDPVYLFVDEASLSTCFNAIQSNNNPKEACAPGIAASIPDGARVKTLSCHESGEATCLVSIIGGDESGIRGALMWDWMQPGKAASNPEQMAEKHE